MPKHGSRPSDQSQVYRISWTWNRGDRSELSEVEFGAYHQRISDLFERDFSKAKFLFSLERGEAEGRLHYQGHIKLASKLRPVEFAKRVRAVMPGIHVSADSSIGSTDAEFYAFDRSKPSFVSGPYANKEFIVPDYSDLEAPRGWQLHPAGVLRGPPQPRVIYWYYEPTGSVGKSNFCTYMELNHGIIGLGLGMAADNYYAVSELAARGYIFDVPRTQPSRFEWSDVYASLEKIKDRNFLSTKYKPKKVILPVIPHIMVFANEKPNIKMLSRDRWRVFKIMVTDVMNTVIEEHL